MVNLSIRLPVGGPHKSGRNNKPVNGRHEQHVDAAEQVVNVNDRRDSDRLTAIPDELADRHFHIQMFVGVAQNDLVVAEEQQRKNAHAITDTISAGLFDWIEAAKMAEDL